MSRVPSEDLLHEIAGLADRWRTVADLARHVGRDAGASIVERLAAQRLIAIYEGLAAEVDEVVGRFRVQDRAA